MKTFVVQDNELDILRDLNSVGEEYQYIKFKDSVYPIYRTEVEVNGEKKKLTLLDYPTTPPAVSKLSDSDRLALRKLYEKLRDFKK